MASSDRSAKAPCCTVLRERFPLHPPPSPTSAIPAVGWRAKMFEGFGDVNLLANPGMCQLFVCERGRERESDREIERLKCVHTCALCVL